MITNKDVESAFRKLLSYAYYDKSDMCLRRNIANFVKNISESDNSEESVFSDISTIGNGENDKLLKAYIDKIKLNFYPKKLKEEKKQDDHLVTNQPSESIIIDKFLVNTDIPIELMILDTLWVIKYGFQIDGNLYDDSYGNRLDLTTNKDSIRKGNAFFKKYSTQYQNWWMKGLDAANDKLRRNENITIINFDIKNYYHSIDFDFDEMLNAFLKINSSSDIKTDPLTSVIRKIYEGYWKLKESSNAFVFVENKNKRSLPLSMMSAGVFANWYLDCLDSFITKQYNPLYYGRYVDDCMVVVNSKSNASSSIKSLNEELPNLFNKKGKALYFKLKNPHLKNLSIQKDKLYIYRFDCEIPSVGIEKYVNDQMERSSEFRFLTDEGSNNSLSLEKVTLVNALDANNTDGKRFDILEESKFKLAVYLSKLASRLAKYPNDINCQKEVEKIHMYFKHSLLIKHYHLWEKLLSIYVLSGHKDYAKCFFENTNDLIEQIDVNNNAYVNKKEQIISDVIRTLKQHLNESYIMALSLYPGESSVDSIYLDTFMTRMHFNMYPMQEFSSDFKKNGCRSNINEIKISKENLDYNWVPYYVKYHDIVCCLAIGKNFNVETYKDAYEIYTHLNHIEFSEGWRAFLNTNKKYSNEIEFNTDLSQESFSKDQLTISLIELDIKEDTKSFIQNFGNIDYTKIKHLQLALDKISEVQNTDVFIMPELSLPLYEVKEFCQYSARKEIAFVCGLEYYVDQNDNTVYNYTITCLPITMFGQLDAVPIIRLKNHYAPAEIENINACGKKIPKETCWQVLYHWKGHTFTTYYCYEIASIKERSYFFSEIDAMYCPVYNPDTYYFNNIAESCSRDMHCYFVLSNVSFYGDSRITMPHKHDKMNILKVKGGNTKDNPVVVLSGTLDISLLRNFQVKCLDDQRKIADFKTTPPGYDKNNVKKRAEHFMHMDNSSDDDNIDNFLNYLTLVSMQY